MHISKKTLNILLIFFITLAVYSLFIKSEFTTTNETSRIGTIQSLVQHHSFQLNTSHWYTNDKILVNGHYYSDKPPTLSFIHAGVYGILHALPGIDFSNDLPRTLFLFVFIVITCISSFSLTIFYKILYQCGCTESVSFVMTLLLAWGTLFFPFSVVYNAHIVSAHLVIFSLYFLTKKEKKFTDNLFLGSLVGLNTSIDILSGVFFLAFISLYVLFFSQRTGKEKAGYLITASAGILLYLILNYFVTHTLIPGALQPSLFSYQNSSFSQQNLTGFYNHENTFSLLTYAFHMLLGLRGLFLYSPILFLSFIGFFIDWKKKSDRNLSLSLALFIVCTMLFAILFSTDYSGGSFGIRWFVPLTPILILFVSKYYAEIRARKDLPKLTLFNVLATISILIAFIGAFFPWSHQLFSLQWNIEYIFSKFF